MALLIFVITAKVVKPILLNFTKYFITIILRIIISLIMMSNIQQLNKSKNRWTKQSVPRYHHHELEEPLFVDVDPDDLQMA